MHYDVSTPEEYLRALDEGWRKQSLLQIRELIISASSLWKESIEYKMLCYSLRNKTVFHLTAQKSYVSLYVGNHRKIDTSGELLKGLDVGKGCIRFTKSISIPETQIGAFIVKTVEKAKTGESMDC